MNSTEFRLLYWILLCDIDKRFIFFLCSVIREILVAILCQQQYKRKTLLYDDRR